MALALRSVDTVNLVSKLIKNPLIDSEFRDNYQEIYDMVVNPETKTGMIKALAAFGVFKHAVGSVTIKAHEGGTNHEHTWEEYGKSIKQWLKNKVNPEARFEIARDCIARYIYQQHYFKYPRWPGCAADANKGENPPQEIRVELKGKYNYNNETIIWCADGRPSVMDQCIRTGPKSFRYYTEVRGNLTFEVLFMDKYKLQKFNAIILKDGKAAWIEYCKKFKDKRLTVSALSQSLKTAFAAIKFD
mmetsp:Transcript_53860/g.66015  ORF Transcript_53860/g.66015 Transcript_53860/m.66015 type:complete len:245 (+) Transcript_53860:65-799(+)